MIKQIKPTTSLPATSLPMGTTASAVAASNAKYADVPEWAGADVDTVTKKGFLNGRSETVFGADEGMTRAELVTALYRLAGSPAVAKEAKNPYSDVAEDANYRDAVVWACGQKIISSKSSGVFDPEGDVERQETAKIVGEFAARRMGKEALYSREDVLSAYPDAADVSIWARGYMNWAVASGFLTGSRLRPRETVTRAEAAAILCRYMEDAGTGDASRDNPLNQDGIGGKELLVVSFGTSFNDSRTADIGAVEEAVRRAFPHYSVRRCFTSGIIIEHVFRRDGELIDNVRDALERAKANGVEELLVQPTHLMNGWEYGDLVMELKDYAGSFQSIRIGAPLLTSDDDFAKVANAMVKAVGEPPMDGDTAVCYMGHGTSAVSNAVYGKMQRVLAGMGHENCFIGTVETEPTAEDLAKLVKEAGYTNVILRPMMIVAGDHANNDMAGDGPDSWASVFRSAGLEVQCQVNGLGRLKEVQALLAAHAGDARPLDNTGIAVEPNPAGRKTGTLADGVYIIEAECRQSMFKIDSCALTVESGAMTAGLVLGSENFDKMFAGTAAAGLSAGGAVEGVKDGAGKTAFTLPVAALDKPLDFAVHSVKKDVWYDRTLTFRRDTATAK